MPPKRTSSVKPASASPARRSTNSATNSAAEGTNVDASPVTITKTYVVPPPTTAAPTVGVIRKVTSLIAPPTATTPKDSASAVIVGSNKNKANGGLAKTSPYLVEDDFADGAYQPHTIIFWTLQLVILATATYFSIGSTDAVWNFKMGAGAVCASFLLFCTLYLPDELFVRPHPAVWRFLIGVNILYVSLIIFLIFQDVPTIRSWLAALDPKLALDLPEKSYADDCRLSTPEDPYKWFHTIFDEFLIAHFTGYFCKMLILRDWRIVLIISVLFEVLELSFQHILPNFKECWWDHIIIDICICNAGGMLAGILFLRGFGINEYQWVRLRDIRTVGGKIKRVASQLAPRSIDTYEWRVFESRRHFIVIVYLIWFNLFQEFNAFTIKSQLQMPTSHRLTICRLVIWGFTAIQGSRGLYVYTIEEGPWRGKRVPMGGWLSMATLFVELLWIGKMRTEGNHFREPMPGYVGVPLYTSFVLLGLFFVMHFILKPIRLRSKPFRLATSAVFYAIPLCYIALFFMTNVDMQWGQKPFMEFVEAYRPFGFGPLEPNHLKTKFHAQPPKGYTKEQLDAIREKYYGKFAFAAKAGAKAAGGADSESKAEL